MALRTGAMVVIAMAVVSIWTPIVDPEVTRRWFTWPEMLFLMPMPILTGVAFLGLWFGITRNRIYQPFLCIVAAFLLGFLGLAVSLWPYAVPRVMTIREAASSPARQEMLIWGALIALPVIPGYTGYIYWVFRGPASGHDGYAEK